MHPDVAPILERANAVYGRIWDLLTGTGCDKGLRVTLLATNLDLCLEHYLAIIKLIELELYGSASALVRPLYDAALRGLWVSRCATDDEVKRWSNDPRFKPEDTGKFVMKIDDAYQMGGSLLKHRMSLTSSLHDYTHGGLRQMARRGFGTGQHGYSRRAQADMLDIGTENVLMIAEEYFESAGRGASAVTTAGLLFWYRELQLPPYSEAPPTTTD